MLIRKHVNAKLPVQIHPILLIRQQKLVSWSVLMDIILILIMENVNKIVLIIDMIMNQKEDVLQVALLHIMDMIILQHKKFAF